MQKLCTYMDKSIRIWALSQSTKDMKTLPPQFWLRGQTFSICQVGAPPSPYLLPFFFFCQCYTRPYKGGYIYIHNIYIYIYAYSLSLLMSRCLKWYTKKIWFKKIKTIFKWFKKIYQMQIKYIKDIY